MQIRLNEPATGTRFVVDTDVRKVYGSGVEPPLAQRALASAAEYARYFVRPVPGTATPGSRKRRPRR